MQIPDQRNRPFTGANLTPMVDVVFLLIIFFLVSSHLARQESKLPVDLPAAATHNPLDLVPVSVTVTVNSDRQWLVGGRSLAEPDLERVFRSVVAEEDETASLRIRTDGSVPYRRVEPILRLAAETGLLDIKLAVKDKP
jgi:biopolymer transport protein ExbD